MVIQEAQELWPALVTQAGLDVPTRWSWVLDLLGVGARRRKRWYDTELMNELQEKLFPGQDGKLEDLLIEADPPLPAEVLIRAFLQLLQPFSMMKTDILQMLSAARADASDGNIRIRFHFDPSTDPVDLLLSEFREQMEAFEQCVTTVSRSAWNISKAWGLGDIPHDDPNWPKGRREMTRDDGEIGEWVMRSLKVHDFPPFPDVWRTGHGELDLRLERVVRMLEELLAAYRQHGSDYAALRAAAERSMGERFDSGYRDKNPAELTVRELAQIESDFLGAYIGEWIVKARRVAASEGPGSRTVAQIISAIDQHLPASDEQIIQRVRVLFDILNLPVWKQREQVYAVWVATQIWKALKNQWRVNFHVRDGVLSFAFKGVHLATLQSMRDADVLAWWTELETEASGLPSGKRSRAIKPDYRIRRAPFDAPDADVLVVEVKQYMRGGRANFTAALDDYTYACSRAGVLLANYGPVGTRPIEALPPSRRGRAHIFGQVRPDCPERCADFQHAIETLVGPAGNRNVEGPIDRPLTKPVRCLELRWDDEPRDLDLHVYRFAAQGNDAFHVFFGQARYGNEIKLHGDVTTGRGPERISLERMTGKFVVCVNQYSSDGRLPNSNAVVELFADDEQLQKIASYHCPQDGTGRWWFVCEIDCDRSSIREIGRITAEPGPAT
jgi:hypothetical protein